MKLATILFLRRDGKILLAMKKRGFGEGKWNGAGGKVESGETSLAAAIRETEEEVGVTPLDARRVGRLDFFLEGHPEHASICHIFVATNWEGQPTESEEMRPQWFDARNIPYDDMWADDRFWLPLLLDGKLFEGSATLDGDTIIAQDIKTVDVLQEG